MNFKNRSILALSMAATLALAQSCTPTHSPEAIADAPAYLKRIRGDTTTMIRPILTAGQRIRSTRGAGDYLVVGIPDGLGLYRRDDHLVLLSNHEFTPDRGDTAGPVLRGARVSEFILSVASEGSDRIVTPVSGQAAIERVYDAAGVARDTCHFAKLCSATLGDSAVGFDRPIFLTGEEWGATGSFDGKGGMSFAVFEGSAYALPRFGRFRKENQVPVRFKGSRMVVFCLEDDDARPWTGRFSQLYLYVGEKDTSTRDPLSRNGLNNGELFVFAADDAAIHGEEQLEVEGGSLRGHWESVDWKLDDVALEAAAQHANAFDMVRVEDGAANPALPGDFWFVTTGGPDYPYNRFGRLYRLTFDAKNPAGGTAKLEFVLAGRKDGMVSPDNIDLNMHGELAICEDPTYNLSEDLGLERDTYLWIYDIKSSVLTPVAEIDRAAALAHARRVNPARPPEDREYKPGDWEASGVVDAEAWLGRGSWILDVQAHSLRIEPVRRTVEGGQYLHVVWKAEGVATALGGRGGPAPDGH